jgi:surface carbohydrate biosynthesis protein
MGLAPMAPISGDATQERAAISLSPTQDLPGQAFYLLIEDAGRELDARVLTACELLNGGAEVWIGQQLWFARNFAALKPGVVLFKGNNMPQVANMRAARMFGHRTASIDEEMFGLVEASGKRIHDSRVTRHCDLLLAQGDAHRTFIERDLRASPDQVRVVGNPRADLLRAPANTTIAPPAHAIRERMGSFILINTNTSAINPHDQDTYNYYQRCIAIKAVDPDDPKNMETFHALCDFESRNLWAIATFIAAYRDLAPKHKIVLRPHPAEDPNSWKRAYEGDGNVIVVEDRRHLAWIQAADALVHTSCTTGLEGFLLGTRTMGLVPDPGNPFSKLYLSNLVSEIYQDPVAAAIALTQPSPDRESALSVIDPLLKIDPNETATKKVVDALRELAAAPARDPGPRRPREIIRGFTPNQRQKNQMSVSHDQLRKRLEKLGSAVGFHRNVHIENFNRDVFRLSLYPRGGTP